MPDCAVVGSVVCTTVQGDNVADDGHELRVVLGTSFSEPVLPGLLMKLERLGCERGVVGLVLPPAAPIARAALAAASGAAR